MPVTLRLAAVCVGLVVFWSSGFIGAHLAADVGWLTTLTWRFLIAALTLVVACLVLRVRIPLASLPAQLGVGLLSQVVYLSGVFIGISHGVPSGTAALIASLQPMVVAVVAGGLLGERTSLRQRIGLLIGVAGVGIVVSRDLSGSATWWAYLTIIGSMLALSAGTVLSRRTSQRVGISLLAGFTVQSVLTAASFLVLSLATDAFVPPSGGSFWVAVGWLVLLSSFGGYGCYQYVVAHGSATLASTLLYLTPPTTMLWAALMFGDSIGLLTVVGLAVCGAGVALVLARPFSAGPAGTDRSAAP